MTFPIERNLINHPPVNREIIEAMEGVRYVAQNFASAVDRICPESREKSLALTNLEQSVMWAIASLARADYDRQVATGQMADDRADAGLDPK